MELKITIDNVNMGGTIEELFRALSQEQREKIATEIVKQFLTEPAYAERKAEETRIIELLIKNDSELRIRNDWGRRIKASNLTHEQIKNTEEFIGHMKEFVSVREKMVEQIVSSAQTAFNKEIAGIVQNDPYIQEVKQIVVQEVKSAFPQFAQNAITSWFAKHMLEVQQTAISALTDTNVNKVMIETIQGRISSLSKNY